MSLPTRPTAYTFDEMPKDHVRPGFSRTAVRGEDGIVTINWFEPGYRSTGQHHHPVDQLAFVMAGSLRFFLGDEVIDLHAPAVLYIPPDVPHGAEPLGDERVLNIDVFAPVREDFRFLTTYQDGPAA